MPTQGKTSWFQVQRLREELPGMIRDAVAESEERLYQRLKNGALSEIHEKIDGMAGAVTRFEDVPAQLQEVNRRLDAIETNASPR